MKLSLPKKKQWPNYIPKSLGKNSALISYQLNTQRQTRIHI